MRSDPADLLCAKIEAAKRGARNAGVDLFVNARIDVLLARLASPPDAVEAILSRAALYRNAGCDGIFVPLISNPNDVQTVAKAIDPLPLNVMAIPGLPSAAELTSLGARRLSAGAAVARAAIRLSGRLTEVFLKEGRSQDLYQEIRDDTNINALFLQD